MKKIIVLGAGMVGSAMAIDLLKSHQVCLADIDTNRLNQLTEQHSGLQTLPLNVSDEVALKKALEAFDLVVCAVPGFLGYQTLKAIISCKKDVVDISFFPEDALELDELAKAQGVTAIVDCGVAPGMDNILLGYHNAKMEVESFVCLVGGLPKTKKWPFQYKAPFSPIDVIEEYTRPARYVENGKEIVREALSDVEHLEFEGIGTLESFNSDGLRSLIHTMPNIPNMKEKTLRYPGHTEYIRVLRDSGFFETKSMAFKGQEIIPLEVTSQILFKDWKLDPDELELTVMRITIEGKNKAGQREKLTYDLHDEYCSETKTSSMARTTGYTATAAANLVLSGLFAEKGVFPPELVGKHEACTHFVLEYLKERGVVYRLNTERG